MQASQRVWASPIAESWCSVIAGTGYIKSANDESLAPARDEGGGRNLVMEVATYKTVQGRRLRMTPATAKHFYRLWMSSDVGHGGVYDD